MRLELRKEPGSQLLGSACIEDGIVVLIGGLRTFEGWVLWDRNLDPIRQADGEPWLRALRREFRTPYVYAELHEK